MPRQAGRQLKGYKAFRVIHDPLDTFTENSNFSRNEIKDMLTYGYLAKGTRFEKRNGQIFEVVEGYQLERVK